MCTRLDCKPSRLISQQSKSMDLGKSASIRIALRIFALVAGAVVIGCIAGKLLYDFSAYDPYSGRQVTKKVCVFHLEEIATTQEFKKIACELGIASGAAAVLLAVVFCVLDYMVANQAGSEVSTRNRRFATIVGSVLAIIMALVWATCFGYLTKLWIDSKGYDWPDEYKIPGQATLAFSSLSIITWIIVAVLGFTNLGRIEVPRHHRLITS
ncbi:uncharacterized protein LOC134184899 [Corticium candelabrum]|uniref:uncharacterized protein LOC134184899 n=1 Tax=Corticium candelabrum TaxID=121492 RepID=UPI002E300F20|nr:uncharacterized protein LOC134184899 [Corticium candelabrum]